MTTRRGTVLILVVGIIAMLAALSAAFLGRMRGDAQESETIVREAQCRLMLHAAMNWIQEASRVGYGQLDPTTGRAVRTDEAWGWIDVRDGSIGPRLVPASAVSGLGTLPSGGEVGLRPGQVLRAPMYLMERPPFAIKPTVSSNPIPALESDPHFGIPSLVHCDPLPQLPPAAMPAVDSHAFERDPTAMAAQRAAWAAGDPTPVEGTSSLAWFRVYRETGTEPDRPAEAGPAGATFVVTVGAGATQGFRDWGEIPALERERLFASDPGIFDQLIALENRQWYRVQWSAAVGKGTSGFFLLPHGGYSNQGPQTLYQQSPVNASRWRWNEDFRFASTPDPRNYIGTIQYIQRLAVPPARW